MSRISRSLARPWAVVFLGWLLPATAAAEAFAPIEQIAAEGGRPIPALLLPGTLSADCQSIAYVSRGDVYVLDRPSGRDVLASLSTAGRRADKSSSIASLSHDGGIVAFGSLATNLVLPRSSRHSSNIYVRDLAAGVTLRVSRAADGGLVNGWSSAPSLSGNGRVVAFGSSATNLVPGDRNGWAGVFVHELASRRTERVSVTFDGSAGTGGFGPPVISRDGRFVAFSSEASNLVSDDDNGDWDVFLRDRRLGRTYLISRGRRGRDAHGASDQPTISADGRWVAFASEAPNLVGADRNGLRDVFVYDRFRKRMRRASVTPAGEEGDGSSDGPSLRADGRMLVFASEAGNLVPDDRNGLRDVFVRDLRTGELTRVSRSWSGGETDDESGRAGPALSADGRCVVFDSFASNLVESDDNGREDVFLRELRH